MIKSLRRLARTDAQPSAIDQHLAKNLANLKNEITDAKILTAQLLVNHIKTRGIYDNIQEAEFKVFSQVGDDGIIQYLAHHLEVESHSFIEFGVENYVESNTRFLLMNNNWKGLVIDASKENIDYIKTQDIYWKHDLTAVEAFVDRENINKIFSEYGFTGEVGLLSIDIDGNDYWIWEAINIVNPTVVVVEYNSVFGAANAVTIPYDPTFMRTRAHHSNLYFGTSLKALCMLAARKGYSFIGSNSTGINAYFVREDRLGKLKTLTFKQGYVESKIRESRNTDGELTYISSSQRVRTIEEMPVYDVETGQIVKLKELSSR